ncbi:MAG: hypothetical protein QOJ35_1517 [Solirubrobacteraceae bacterium]|nr:hypothetical protein [Solirubrobacteraceae bacterium]
MLYGPGGVGKSSLLHAGVVHRLRAIARPEPADEDDDEDGGTVPRTGVVIVDDWSGDPAARLAAEIRALAGDAQPPLDGGAPPASGATALRDAVRAHRDRNGGGLLVILDQFEEYVRQHPDPREQEFDDVLAELVRDSRSPVRVLIAIREDRLADLDRFAGRIPQLLSNTLRLGPLSPRSALEAIERPIERYAATTGHEVALEPGLAQTVCDQLVELNQRRRSANAAGGNGAGREQSVDSSYLQLVMRKLWDEDVEARGGTLIRRATLPIGGVGEIVTTHLDGALDHLSPDEQALAAAMLGHLVTPSGATVCLTAHDLAVYTRRPEADVVVLAEKLSRPPARILRGVAGSNGVTARGGYELAPVLAEPAAEWAARRRTLALERRARRLLLGLVTMTAIAIALVGYSLQPGIVKRLESASVDQRFELRGAQPPDGRIALVTRPRAARNPRARLARALRAIATADPRAVALNISYIGSANPDKHDHPAAADASLVAAVNGPLADRLALATDVVDSDGKATLFGREDQRFGDHDSPAVGWDGLPLDAGGVVRRITPAASFVPAESGAAEPVKLDRLAVVTARLAGGPRPEKLPSRAWIDYRGADGTFPRIALDDVLARRPEALAKLRGKVVLVSYTAGRFRTSAPGPGMMSPAEIQANAISTALDGFPLRDGGRLLDVVLIVLLGLLPLALALRLRPALVAALGIAAAVLFCVVAQLAFASGRVISIVTPLSSLVLATIAVTAVLVLRARGARPAPSEGPLHSEPPPS